jgi:hypothetical protein
MAERAFQELGELLTKALISGDFELYRSILCLPMKFTPKDGPSYTLTDEAALREDFDLYVSIIRLHGVTDIYRQVQGHEPVGEGQIVVRVVTHILVRANLLVAPFPTKLLLQEAADGWRIAEIESSEGHMNWTMGRASVSPSGDFETGGGVNDET